MREQRGQALVIVMTLITVLTLAGAAMAMAVEANMHSLDVVSGLDRVHYAAESAVARGQAATIQSQSCPSTGVVNRTTIAITCEAQVQNISSTGIQSWANRGQSLDQNGCLSMSLSSIGWRPAVWTVLAWRGPRTSGLLVWIDGHSDCSGAGDLLTPKRSFSSSPAYFASQMRVWDELDNQPALHVRALGAAVAIGSFVVRIAQPGSDNLVTVLGQAGTELDESDVALPNNARPSVTLWHTVFS